MTTLGFLITLVLLIATLVGAFTGGWLLVFLPLLIGLAFDLAIFAVWATVVGRIGGVR